ncbi:unnamed protein product [Caenorhabditis angaria]|uniref:Uncharacterized protein n=1 Tax=Caenorhabditis angaria TaxID=860376 RepID=A0A9P1N7L3_9PELO|nr:unnamed protein product [Caenorhabditis angaria]
MDQQFCDISNDQIQYIYHTALLKDLDLPPAKWIKGDSFRRCVVNQMFIDKMTRIIYGCRKEEDSVAICRAEAPSQDHLANQKSPIPEEQGSPSSSKGQGSPSSSKGQGSPSSSKGKTSYFKRIERLMKERGQNYKNAVAPIFYHTEVAPKRRK